ncbi:heat-inducible transcriptional repressor HrcA [Pseudoroseicyclus tamaricis]|uniref:Heat-inducible transcription repressor HrcA n=1 Tax=Pseudoroseicyclus tamaricis TaxID=2705421 RepID=A0A6B2K1D1_9RHOB|nr:heat-inducible transcriptional repressor HrcA [Pseudoroseicyclus tamaricis]NDV02769.1 heat-inducible transcriptional repressor HrcA [Pseudoroseicyclus tamaricis]
MQDTSPNIQDLSDRSREVFRRVVEAYLETGAPVGSRSLTRQMSQKVSAATIRNTMQDLEYLGLLGAPHISAGRMPTEAGLRMFVDGLLEVSAVGGEERELLEGAAGDQSELPALLDRVGSALSGLTRGASLVLAPKHEAPIRHVEFLSLAPDRALVVLVFADGHVENRLFTPPPGQTPASLREAANFVSAIAEGRGLSELRTVMSREIKARRQEIDSLAASLVETGLASWAVAEGEPDRLIVRGRGNLLSEDAASEADLERIRLLFDDLERKRDIASFLELAEGGEGVRIFIGSENKLFSLSGSSLVVSPYMNADRKIIGAVGIIGPTRLNYGRIVPIVDYTAQLVGRLLAGRA